MSQWLLHTSAETRGKDLLFSNTNNLTAEHAMRATGAGMADANTWPEHCLCESKSLFKLKWRNMNSPHTDGNRATHKTHTRTEETWCMQRPSVTTSLSRWSMLLHNIPPFMKELCVQALFIYILKINFCISELNFLKKINILSNPKTKCVLTLIILTYTVNVFLATPMWTEIT